MGFLFSRAAFAYALGGTLFIVRHNAILISLSYVLIYTLVYCRLILIYMFTCLCIGTWNIYAHRCLFSVSTPAIFHFCNKKMYVKLSLNTHIYVWFLVLMYFIALFRYMLQFPSKHCSHFYFSCFFI